jgi:hypothetical protein
LSNGHAYLCEKDIAMSGDGKDVLLGFFACDGIYRDLLNACLVHVEPRKTRHRIRSNVDMRERSIVPAMDMQQDINTVECCRKSRHMLEIELDVSGRILSFPITVLQKRHSAIIE